LEVLAEKVRQVLPQEFQVTIQTVAGKDAVVVTRGEGQMIIAWTVFDSGNTIAVLASSTAVCPTGVGCANRLALFGRSHRSAHNTSAVGTRPASLHPPE
jgi:hypothetical protein